MFDDMSGSHTNQWAQETAQSVDDDMLYEFAYHIEPQSLTEADIKSLTFNSA